MAGYHQGAQASHARRPILDDPSANRSVPPNDPSPEPGASRPAPKGLREQLSATIAAAVRIGRAHVALAQAEFGQILAEGKRVGILAGIAFGLLLFAGLLLPIGLTLFVGEWLFGSIGWGVLLGTELTIGGAIVLVFAGLYVPIPGSSGACSWPCSWASSWRSSWRWTCPTMPSPRPAPRSCHRSIRARGR